MLLMIDYLHDACESIEHIACGTCVFDAMKSGGPSHNSPVKVRLFGFFDVAADTVYDSAPVSGTGDLADYSCSLGW
jgi:hypothetical protein